MEIDIYGDGEYITTEAQDNYIVGNECVVTGGSFVRVKPTEKLVTLLKKLEELIEKN